MELVGSDFSRKPRVLVVDDNRLNRDLLQAYLLQMEAEVVLAVDGVEALELATQDPPDLILTDLQMPRMDGLELCRYLKLHPLTQFVPVVMLTALEGDDEKIKALEAGVDDFMNKPFSAIMLMARARTLLKNKHLNDQIQNRNRLLRHMLNRYVTEEVADVILTDPSRHLKLGGDTRTVTVLFADIRGFTRFTEKLTAEQVVETLNRIFEALTRVVFEHHGTFDKYVGDALMAFFGAPFSGPDDTRRAAQTALKMQALFNQLQTEGGEDDIVTQLGLGIGMNTGPATVGNVGSESVMDYTVIGDTVNVAARLQEEARAGQIVISQATYDAIREEAAVDKLGQTQVRGRREPVTLYVLNGLKA